MDRAGLPLSQKNVKLAHANNTLIVTVSTLNSLKWSGTVDTWIMVKTYMHLKKIVKIWYQDTLNLSLCSMKSQLKSCKWKRKFRRNWRNWRLPKTVMWNVLQADTSFLNASFFFIKLEITVLPSEPFMENCLRFEKLYSRHKRNGPSDSVFIVLYIFILLHLPVHMHE